MTVTVTAQITLVAQDLAELAEIDPNGVAVSTGEDELTNSVLDRWSNRLARILVGVGASHGAPVVLALDPSIESVVVAWALAKTGAIGVDAGTEVPAATFGITTRNRRGALSDSVDWLILDEPATMRRYMTVEDGPLEDSNVAA